MPSARKCTAAVRWAVSPRVVTVRESLLGAGRLCLWYGSLRIQSLWQAEPSMHKDIGYSGMTHGVRMESGREDGGPVTVGRWPARHCSVAAGSHRKQ